MNALLMVCATLANADVRWGGMVKIVVLEFAPMNAMVMEIACMESYVNALEAGQDKTVVTLFVLTIAPSMENALRVFVHAMLDFMELLVRKRVVQTIVMEMVFAEKECVFVCLVGSEMTAELLTTRKTFTVQSHALMIAQTAVNTSILKAWTRVVTAI
jgi:hypothetical protein